MFRGVVTDSVLSPLADVDLTLLPGALRSRTDSTGRFSFTVSTAGTYRLVARRIGFASDTFSVALPAGVTTVRRVQLSRIQWLARVEIRALADVLPRMLERVDRGLSQVMLQDEIKAYRVYDVNDLLRFVPRFNRLGQGRVVFVDGRPSRGPMDYPHPSDIVAIEITNGMMGWDDPALWPPFWMNRSDWVTIVMIWTRAYTSDVAARNLDAARRASRPRAP